MRSDPEYPNGVDVVKANRLRGRGDAMHEATNATASGLPAVKGADATQWCEERGDYAIRLARTAEDRRRVQALRFEVFSRELGARVEGAEWGLDIDPLDDITLLADATHVTHVWKAGRVAKAPSA